MKRIMALSAKNIWFFIFFLCCLLMQGCSHPHIEDVRMMGYIFKPRIMCALSDSQFCLFQQMEEYGHIQRRHFPGPPMSPGESLCFLYFYSPKNYEMFIKPIHMRPSIEKGVCPPFVYWFLGTKCGFPLRDYDYITKMCAWADHLLDKDVLTYDTRHSECPNFPALARYIYFSEKKCPGLNEEDEWYMFAFDSLEYKLLFNRNKRVVFVLYPLGNTCYDVWLLDSKAEIEDTTLSVTKLSQLLSDVIEKYGKDNVF